MMTVVCLRHTPSLLSVARETLRFRSTALRSPSLNKGYTVRGSARPSPKFFFHFVPEKLRISLTLYELHHKIMIIDSHLHISYLGEKKKNLFDEKKELLESMKQFGIDYSIVIPDNVPNPQCADTETMFEIIEGEKQFFSMGTINIFQDIKKQILNLESLITAKKICAIKLFPGHDPFYPIDERCLTVYDLCVKYNIPVVFHTGVNTGDSDCAKYNDPKHIVAIAERYKGLKIVIAHFFWPKMEYCYMLDNDTL